MGLRRNELERGQSILCEHFPHVADLGEARIDQLERLQGLIPAKPYRRCRHVITENQRVREAAEALRAGDPWGLGHAMIQSHESQRDDFEDSVPEIDFLVETALAQKECRGARLTGGGFGGCTVNLVETTAATTFGQELAAGYRSKYGIHPEIYICSAADGALARLGPQPMGAAQ